MPYQVSKSSRPLGQVAGALGLSLFLGCGLASALDQSTTATQAWSGPQELDGTAAFAEKAPSAAMDTSGNVFMAWDQVNASGQILADLHPYSATAWNSPVVLPGQSGSAADPSVAVGNGNFGMAWDQAVGSGNSVIEFQFYNPGGTPTFGPTKPLDAGPGSAPVVAMDVSGDVAVVWTELLPSGFTAIQVQRCTAGSPPNWGASVATVSNQARYAFSPRVGTDDLGNVVVAWLEAADPSTGPYTLQTAWFIFGTQTWYGPYSPQLSATDAIAPGFALAMNTPPGVAGIAQVAWSESTDGGSTYQLYTTGFNAATGAWGTPLMVSAAAANAFQPAVALDHAGDILLAWTQGAQSPSTAALWGAAYATAPELWSVAYTFTAPGAGLWSTPAALPTTTPFVQAPTLAMSPSGLGALAWQGYLTSTWRIYGSLNSPGYGWSYPATLNVVSVATGGDASAPTVACNDIPQAVVAWSQAADASLVSHVYTNIYQ